MINAGAVLFVLICLVLFAYVFGLLSPWHKRYSFYVTEMKFMTSDDYRLPIRDHLRAMWRARKPNTEI